MFNAFYNLAQNPFSETPDVDFFFQSTSHQSALYKLVQMIDAGSGFGVLIGEVGLGKTLLSRVLLELGNESFYSALIFYPKLNDVELLQAILGELGESASSNNLKELFDQITENLICSSQENKKTILVVDEAQHLSVDALEVIRMLSNIEMNKQKLIHIILIGQPELAKKLNSHECRQIEQRISTRVQLVAFNSSEVYFYIKESTETAGASNYLRFEKEATDYIYTLSKGNPRLVNMICSLVLNYGAENKNRLFFKKQIQHALEHNNYLPSSTSLVDTIYQRVRWVFT
ncbi:MAG: AAA family ATPase [Bdellovibrionaceae bacterium]|jgi:general secretion pathway protein A|nr:AAA family ATPase [Pseudobdellovibrionaceae bacterium]